MEQTVGDIGEFELISHIERIVGKEGVKLPESVLSVGDDAASFMPEQGYELLVTCDSMVEGRHYLPEYFSPFEIGRRAMAMNISDIGAMGGKPLYALVSLGLKSNIPVKDIEEIYRGFLTELNPFNASIIGGNVTGTDYSIMIDITLIGKVEKSQKVLRSTAREGDSIMVTGYPGQAAAGLRMLLKNEDKSRLLKHPLVDAYIRPEHRAVEGHMLAMTGRVNSMIDISDGFLGDLGHICERSGVGAEIHLKDFPVSEYLRSMADSTNESIYDVVLGESDDYELIFTCSHDDVEYLKSLISKKGNTCAKEVGRITGLNEGIKIVSENGIRRDIKPSGWDHFK